MFFRKDKDKTEIMNLLNSKNEYKIHEGLNKLENTINRWGNCFIDSLINLLNHADEWIVWQTANILNKFKDKSVKPLLKNLDNKNADPHFKYMMIKVLSTILAGKRNKQLLVKLTDIVSTATDTQLQCGAITAIEMAGVNKKYAQKIYETLIKQIPKDDINLRYTTLRFFRNAKDMTLYNLRPLINYTVVRLCDKDSAVRCEARDLLGSLLTSYKDAYPIINNLKFTDRFKQELDLVIKESVDKASQKTAPKINDSIPQMYMCGMGELINNVTCEYANCKKDKLDK